MAHQAEQETTTPRPPVLHLIIIGAGLAGLAAAISTRLEGHRVTVLEKSSELQEVGAGLQITPSASRLFRRWGVFHELEDCVAVPMTLSVRRYDGGKLLAHEELFQEKIMSRYGSPFWDIHRADLQRVLVARAKALGIELRLSAEVVDIDFTAAEVLLQGGEKLRGDLVLAADGLWSRSRSLFSGRQISPEPTGDLAYRIMLKIDDIRDPELRQWVSEPRVTLWAGPYSHAVGYSVRKGRFFNIVLLCPDDLPENVSVAKGNVEELKKMFESWDPILSKFLACVNEVEKWRLMHISEVDTWKNDEGTFAMAGDACHPMLPYLAMGANSALEDGAVLGRLLRYVTGPEKISEALDLYQKVRKKRGEAIARETFKQREAFHLPDGRAQKERDSVFEASLGGEPSPNFPSRWTCPTVQPWLYRYDAVAEADAAYQQNSFEHFPSIRNDGHEIEVRS